MPEHISLDEYHEAARELSMLDGVRTAQVETEHPDVDGACIVVRVDGRYERVPPRVLRALANYDLGTRPDLSGEIKTAWQLVVV